MTYPAPRNPETAIIRAFTLLEIMMVVAIIGLMMTMGVPAILRTMHQAPLRKAVNDVVTICRNARSQAILSGVTTAVIFHPQSEEVSLTSLAGTNAPGDLAQPDQQSDEAKTSVPGMTALNSTRFEDGVKIDMLDINLTECKDADAARVRFFPNGTCDEMTLILNQGGQYLKISLEVTTGLASVETVR